MTTAPATRRRKRFYSPRFPRRRRGVLMFVVTIVIAMLTLGGLSLLALMRVEKDSTRTRLQEMELTNVTRSASALIQGVSELSVKERERLGGIYQNPNLFCARNVLGEQDGGEFEAFFSVLSPRLEREERGIRYGLVNESTRLNLGTILEWDKASPGTGREVLMKLPGMTPIMADSLLDWIDVDEITRPSGAEASYYSAARLTYSPRNALPISLDELLLVRGITRYQLYGEDTLFNFRDLWGEGKIEGLRARSGEGDFIGSLAAPTSEQIDRHFERGRGIPQEAAPSELTVPWARLLTVFSAERDLDPKGQPRIDLNEKNLTFLFDELAAYVNEEVAAFVILYRQFGPASAAGGTAEKLGKEAINFDLPAKHRFETPLDIVGAAVAPPNSGKVYHSPFDDQRQSVTGLFQYLDYVSVGSSVVIYGRVNVNEAPPLILSAIPDLPEEAVEKIVNARPLPGDPVPAEKRHAAWLYATGIVDLPTMKKLWPKLTTTGDVFRGQIVAFSGASGEARRGEVVVDASVSPPRQVFYKDLTMYGRGFSMAALLHQVPPNNSLQAELNQTLQREIAGDSPFGQAENLPFPSDPFGNVEDGLNPSYGDEGNFGGLPNVSGN